MPKVVLHQKAVQMGVSAMLRQFEKLGPPKHSLLADLIIPARAPYVPVGDGSGNTAEYRYMTDGSSPPVYSGSGHYVYTNNAWRFIGGRDPIQALMTFEFRPCDGEPCGGWRVHDKALREAAERAATAHKTLAWPDDVTEWRRRAEQAMSDYSYSRRFEQPGPPVPAAAFGELHLLLRLDTLPTSASQYLGACHYLLRGRRYPCSNYVYTF